MIAYVTLGARDLDQGVAFYDAVLEPVGFRRFARHDGFVAYGPDGRSEGQTIWVCRPFDGHEARGGNGVMLALDGADHAAVDAFHAAAMAHGASDEGGPGLREHYGPNWYAAYVRDPTGNKLACVCNKPQA